MYSLLQGIQDFTLLSTSTHLVHFLLEVCSGLFCFGFVLCRFFFINKLLMSLNKDLDLLLLMDLLTCYARDEWYVVNSCIQFFPHSYHAD